MPPIRQKYPFSLKNHEMLKKVSKIGKIVTLEKVDAKTGAAFPAPLEVSFSRFGAKGGKAGIF